jgi:hypothetical protein
VQDADAEVESKRAKVKLNQWVRLHDHNIAQKVMVIVEHFKDNVMGLLGGQAKAMVVTSSRKEAVRYKQCFDKYITEKGYQKIHAMVAFSGGGVHRQRPGCGGPDRREVHRDEYEPEPQGPRHAQGFRFGRLPGDDRRQQVPDRV